MKFLVSLFLLTLMSAVLSTSEAKEDKIDPQILKESAKPYDIMDIHKKIREIKPQIDACYIKAVSKKKSTQEGKIKVNFTISNSGKANNLNIKSSTLKHKKVETCIVKTISTVTFPPSLEEIIEVNYPFDFKNPYKGNK